MATSSSIKVDVDVQSDGIADNVLSLDINAMSITGEPVRIIHPTSRNDRRS